MLSEVLTHTAEETAFLKALKVTRAKTIFCAKIMHVYAFESYVLASLIFTSKTYKLSK